MNSSGALQAEAARLLSDLFVDLGGQARLSAPPDLGTEPEALLCLSELDGRAFSFPVIVMPRYLAASIKSSSALAAPNALLIAPRLGAAARERLRAQGINHADFGGVVYLRLPGIRVDRERSDRPRPRNWSPDEREINPFSKKASRILRTLLESPHVPVRVSELAKNNEVAVGWASGVADALVKRGYATHGSLGVQLHDHIAALADWTKAYSWRRNAVYTYVVPLDRESMLERMRSLCQVHSVPWALTLLAGAERRVGYVRHAGPTYFYFNPSSEQERAVILEQLYAEPSPREGNLALLEPYHGPGAYSNAHEVNGVPVVSDLQLFLDLVHFPLRGIEAAEMLVRQRLAAQLRLDGAGVNRLLDAVG